MNIIQEINHRPIMVIVCTDGVFKNNPLSKTDIAHCGFTHIEGDRYHYKDWVLYYDQQEAALLLTDPDNMVRLDCTCKNIVMLSLLLLSVGLAKEVDVEYLTE